VTFKIVGTGARGYPHLSRDPILAAGHLITQIHSIVSRSIHPLDSAVISFGKIGGGTAFNIIPEAVELLATVRSLTPKVRETLRERMEQVSQGVARSFGLECQFNYDYGYPALVNDPKMSFVVTACGKAIGKAWRCGYMGGKISPIIWKPVPSSAWDAKRNQRVRKPVLTARP
jgi:amidohydrolase